MENLNEATTSEVDQGKINVHPLLKGITFRRSGGAVVRRNANVINNSIEVVDILRGKLGSE
jgi:hypothetical protein